MSRAHVLEGQDARRHDIKRSFNPHREGSWAQRDWYTGWDEQDMQGPMDLPRDGLARPTDLRKGAVDVDRPETYPDDPPPECYPGYGSGEGTT